jgi:superfamily II DNA or RNA helicase
VEKFYQKEEKKIRVYHTHIEISPYTFGENEKLERQLSIWVDAEYRYDPYGYYIENDVLYIPRGYNTYFLEKNFNSTAFVVREADKHKNFRGVHMLGTPRDRIQKEAIDFLSAKDKFTNASAYSQQALILDTGDGKTFTTINAILNYHMRALIITHQDKIKTQWINTFKEKTDVPEERLINISGSEIITKIMDNEIAEGYFYFINHQTINSYARTHGWLNIRKFFQKIAVGVKVFDEAHLSFKNVLRVDMFSNTVKTFYLTANFGRSDPKEVSLFRRCFSSVYKFGEETKNYEEKRKHIIYVPVLYRSNPSCAQLQMASNMYGFSVLGFSKYALHVDQENTQVRKFYYVLSIALKLEGKILITVPKISDTEYIKKLIEKEYPDLNKKIETINSSNSKEENAENKDADIICSTIKSCGTGVDIKKLRCIINLEPFSSNITSNQLSGRLREYAKDKDTYFFDLIDIAFPTCERQYKTKLSYLKKKCKEIQVLRL